MSGKTYALAPDELVRLENDFMYHPPTEEQRERYEDLRAHAKSFATFLLTRCPKSRELSLALTKIDEAVFWGNASIARNE